MQVRLPGESDGGGGSRNFLSGASAEARDPGCPGGGRGTAFSFKGALALPFHPPGYPPGTTFHFMTGEKRIPSSDELQPLVTVKVRTSYAPVKVGLHPPPVRSNPSLTPV